MKVVVQDYSSSMTTEPLYIVRHLSQVGVDVVLWKSDLSSFDMVDIHKPDIVIINAVMAGVDLLAALSKSMTKVIVNATLINQQGVNMLENLLNEYGVDCPYLFYNSSYVDWNADNKVQISPGYDELIPTDPPIDYKLPLLTISTDGSLPPEDFDCGEVYHTATVNQPQEGAEFDLVLPMFNPNGIGLCQLLNNYENVVVYGDQYWSQITYQAEAADCNLKLLNPDKGDIIIGSTTSVQRVERMFRKMKENQVSDALVRLRSNS